MQRQTFGACGASWATLPLMLAIAGPIVAAEGPAAQRRAAAEYVSKALQAETEGKNSRREALLDEALEAAPDYARRPLAQRIRPGGQSLAEVR